MKIDIQSPGFTPGQELIHFIHEKMKKLSCLYGEIIGSEVCLRLDSSAAKKNKICTMKTSTNFCAISGYYGYKWPTLKELHYKLFGFDFEDAHNALSDVLATGKCFWELKSLNQL